MKMGYVQGVDRRQIRMIALEDMVDAKAMARVIDRFVEVTDLEKLGFEKTKPAPTGRPAYAPKGWPSCMYMAMKTASAPRASWNGRRSARGHSGSVLKC